MLTRVFRGTSRLAVGSRVARLRADGGIVGSKTVFDDREHALENRAVRDHENQLIEALRKELAAKDNALKQAEGKVRDMEEKDEEEMDYLVARQRKLQRKLMDIQEELDDIRSKLKK